jgi:hypothetical protein
MHLYVQSLITGAIQSSRISLLYFAVHDYGDDLTLVSDTHKVMSTVILVVFPVIW